MPNNATAGHSINKVITSEPTALALAPTTVSPTASSPLDVVHEGWLLKKKRKKLQGYARRYFTLRNNGSLSYSFGQGEEVRDQILLNNAAFSSSPHDRYIHVDSGTATFHLRALSRSDYEEWMAALRKFITMPRPMGTLDAANRHSVNFGRTVSFSIGHATKMNGILDDMSKMIKELTDVAQALSEAHIKQAASTKSKNDHLKESSRDTGLLGLFTRSPSKARSSIVVDEQEPPKDDAEPPKVSDDHIPLTFPGLLSGIDTLQQQHRQLTAAFNALLHLDGVTNSARAMSPTPSLHQDWIGIRVPSRSGTRMRALSVDTISDEEVQWFDADDGPEEYLIEDHEHEAETESDSKAVSETSSQVDQPAETKEKGDEPSVATPQPSVLIKKTVQRRTRLPVPAPSTGMSLIGVLKKNVGKDLSQVSFPVGFNEPISILQRLAEDLEYINLIEQAVATEDPVQRMCLVAAFAVSSYACTRLRAARKPFNPMLGETFEDARFNFIAEKVCHTPPVMACHASGQGWTYDAATQAKQKFWGRSLEIIPIGTTVLKIGKDVFAWSKPSSFMRNIVAGTKYLEHVGTLTITNRTTEARCDIEFKESTMWSSGKDVNATVYSPSENVEAKLWGTWDGHFSRMISQKKMELLWKAEDFPPDAQDYYGFTYFTTTLNEITEDLIIRKPTDGNEAVTYQIPVTDSRFRPDQRALEEGRVDEADEIKMQVEEMQRRRRRAGNDAKPRWFKKFGKEDTDWEYAGGYWETRDAGWAEQEPLW